MPIAPRALFAGLVDDAALFPPGNAPMARGLAEHAVHRAASYADLVGPFLCPASRLAELQDELSAQPLPSPLGVSLVFDVTGDGAHQALRGVAADDRLRLVAVEAAQARLGDAAATIGENLRRLPGAVGYLEVPRTGFADGLDLVAKGGWGAAKYRTGGTTADAFPSDRELADFLVAVAERDLACKLTAGLHHAVRRYDDALGAWQHGVLNVLAAVRAAVIGAQPTRWLAETDPEVLVAEVARWDEPACRQVRARLRSFGCCGVTDPIGELVGLGLTPP